MAVEILDSKSGTFVPIEIRDIIAIAVSRNGKRMAIATKDAGSSGVRAFSDIGSTLDHIHARTV